MDDFCIFLLVPWGDFEPPSPGHFPQHRKAAFHALRAAAAVGRGRLRDQPEEVLDALEVQRSGGGHLKHGAMARWELGLRGNQPDMGVEVQNLVILFRCL